MDDDDVLLLERNGKWWKLRCDSDPGLVGQANDYLGYLADRNYSPRTVRTYGYGLLAFHRWLHHTGLRVDAVVTDDVLGFLTACRQETIPGRPGPNVVDLAGRPTDRLAPASVNLRLASVAGMF
ncbi:site-specific integrase [Tessaracoccus sp.]